MEIILIVCAAFGVMLSCMIVYMMGHATGYNEGYSCASATIDTRLKELMNTIRRRDESFDRVLTKKIDMEV